MSLATSACCIPRERWGAKLARPDVKPVAPAAEKKGACRSAVPQIQTISLEPAATASANRERSVSPYLQATTRGSAITSNKAGSSGKRFL